VFVCVGERAHVAEDKQCHFLPDVCLFAVEAFCLSGPVHLGMVVVSSRFLFYTFRQMMGDLSCPVARAGLFAEWYDERIIPWQVRRTPDTFEWILLCSEMIPFHVVIPLSMLWFGRTTSL
jgi:hypothetical protein